VHRPPWNKGKLVGAKPPLRPSHVWSISTKLQMADRKRDLALFNLAIDSKLRSRDVVACASMMWHRAGMPWIARPPAEEDGPAREVRVDGPNTPRCRE
jgi:hypothetical protein